MRCPGPLHYRPPCPLRFGRNAATARKPRMPYSAASSDVATPPGQTEGTTPETTCISRRASRYYAPTSAGSTRRPPGQASGCARTRGSGIRPSTGLTNPSRRVTRTCGTEAGSIAPPTDRSGPSTRCAGRMEGNMQRPFGSESVPRCGHAHSLPSSQVS